MECLYCCKEYNYNELVFVEPTICPFCILGYSNRYYVIKDLKTNESIERAIQIVKSPRMLHRLKCVVPYK